MTEQPVLAAVSAVSDHIEVLRWAADEAVRRRRPLRLVHVYRDLRGYGTTSVPGFVLVEDAFGLRNHAEGVLNAAHLWVRGRYPELPVTAVLREGDAATVLTTESETAELLVVGRHDRGALAELVLGSVSAALVRTSACPVVAVPLVPPRRPDRIVVGVDGTEVSQAALEFAYAHAERTGLELHVLHCWPTPLDRPSAADRVETRATHRRYLAEAMAGFAQRCPAVDAIQSLREGDPAHELLRHAPRAALLVLGSHGRGQLAAAALGSVGREVLHHARCPVAVVRPAPVPARR